MKTAAATVIVAAVITVIPAVAPAMVWGAISLGLGLGISISQK